MTRMLVVWCPDWPVVATGALASEPVAILFANRVVACSQKARENGVKRGLRQREAQGRCPDIALHKRNPSQEALTFEPLVEIVERIAVNVEVIRPGVCAFATRGPSKYFGGDQALKNHIGKALINEGYECHVGIADGLFAATCAARQNIIVEPDQSAKYLALLPVAALEQPQLEDLLIRLGLKDLGAFAKLPAKDVLNRFGNEGAAAHRLAKGLDPHVIVGRKVVEEFQIQVPIDPPAEQVDRASFAAKAAADQLVDHLTQQGLACRRICIEVETEHGEARQRRWRHDIAFTSSAIADRVRWQLAGWLSSTDETVRPTAGVSLLRLIPDEVVPANGRQSALWGGESDADMRASRAIDRVRGLLGAEGVFKAVLSGGRHPSEQFQLVPWGEGEDVQPLFDRAMPWPGKLPAPAPTVIHKIPLPAAVVNINGEAVLVNRRGTLKSVPARFAINNGEWQQVQGWAGPWLFDERWWDNAASRRRACFQFSTPEGLAVLAAFESGRWQIEARYS